MSTFLRLSDDMDDMDVIDVLPSPLTEKWGVEPRPAPEPPVSPVSSVSPVSPVSPLSPASPAPAAALAPGPPLAPAATPATRGYSVHPMHPQARCAACNGPLLWRKDQRTNQCRQCKHAQRYQHYEHYEHHEHQQQQQQRTTGDTTTGTKSQPHPSRRPGLQHWICWAAGRLLSGSTSSWTPGHDSTSTDPTSTSTSTSHPTSRRPQRQQRRRRKPPPRIRPRTPARPPSPFILYSPPAHATHAHTWPLPGPSNHHAQHSQESQSQSHLAPDLAPSRPLPRSLSLPPSVSLTLAIPQPAAMNAIQQKCRPKHQVLVLKCYPRTAKGAVDVKPNSSELSYLLFYATSRRSKIQKIGAFLEKKTASDVWRMRIGNVQVTLGILAALVEKSPKDIGLIAPCVLKILDLILRSGDITMIESSLPAWDAFCEHHDASLFADQAYSRQYESIVHSYASTASTKPPTAKGPLSLPVQARWRNAGLKAIKSVAASDALSSVTGRQIDVIVPPILQNLWSDDDEFIDVLQQRLKMEEKVESEKVMRRRNSVATVGTADTGPDGHPAAFSGSANDADKLAEEEISILAMQCLKSIFEVPNRAQINGATTALLKFIFEKVGQGQRVVSLGETGNKDCGWAVSIYSAIARWAPVQDRYVILVVAMETLVRNPIKDDKMEQQMALVAVIGALLRSDINLIGLSVMDVLLGLVRQMKKLFQPVGDATDEKVDDADLMSMRRKQLIDRLEQCIGDLATHVYYADQISDMIAAIIGRLKPGRSSSTTSTPQGEKADVDGSTADLTESQSSIDAYFSYGKGRVVGLKVIKAILLVANPKTKISGNVNISRNRVPLHVWEGTQWLLRDPDGEVRKAYVDALGTWLDRETTAADLMARDESLVRNRSMKNAQEAAQRAVSNASNREPRTRSGRRSQFLPLLHLAIYDNALQYVDFEADLAVLHVLLTKLVFRLGVNAVRFGIPMIYRLQEEIQEIELPVHKTRIAALCHGYFWALSEKFDFESSAVGRAIHNEIARRRSKEFWVEGINVPAPQLRTLGTPGHVGSQPTWDLTTLEKEELLPFDDRSSLVECIATNYEESSRSPPVSPAASPGRAVSNPILGSTMSPTPAGDHEQDLPSSFREQMLTDWSRESVVAALASQNKAESLNGSRSGTTGTNRNRLTINTAGANGNGHAIPSPYASPRNLRPHSARMPDRERFGSVKNLRKSSVRSGFSPSTSVKGGIASVDQLKQVLSGSMSAQAMTFPTEEDDSGDSMVSFDYSPSEASYNPAVTQTDRPSTGAEPSLKRSASTSSKGPLSSNPPSKSTPQLDDEDEVTGATVPPVPPIPTSSLPNSPLPNSGSSMSFRNEQGDNISVQDHVRTPRKKTSSRAGSLRVQHNRIPEETAKTMDLQELLRGIDSHGGEGSLGNVTKPPY